MDPLSAPEANRLFYRDFAASYEASEPAVFGTEAQARFRAALARALALVGTDPDVLDACGGSGNVGVALVARGIVPVVVDVSPEMVEIWRAKAGRLGLEPEIHVKTVEEFFEGDGRAWDLITFSSALHHLEEPVRTLELAATRLRPGGAIFTMFDPTRATPAMQALRKADWRIYLALTDPVQWARLALRALRRGSPVEDPASYVGRIAERHTYDGVDDIAIRSALERRGLVVRVHERYVESRLRPVRALLRRIDRPSHFHLVAQAPDADRDGATAA